MRGLPFGLELKLIIVFLQHSDDPVKQTIIAEFQSKVIQAKAEGNEPESSMKKKTLEETITPDASDNGKNSSPFISQKTSVIHSEKSLPLSEKVAKDDLKAEPAVNKDTAIVNDETIKMGNSTQIKTDMPGSKMKIVSDIPHGKISEQVPLSQDETSSVQNAVKEPLSSNQTLNQTSVDNTKIKAEYQQALSTPNRSSNQLEPVSPTPLPETPSSAVAAKPTNNSKYFLNIKT